MVADSESASPAPPQVNGGAQPHEDNGNGNGSTAETDEVNLTQQVTGMRKELSYLTHQVYRILLALHVPPCTCANCTTQHQAQNELILNSAQQPAALHNNNNDLSSDSGHSQNDNDPLCSKPELDDSMSGLNTPNATANVMGELNYSMPAGSGLEAEPAGGPGRRSKYVTHEDKVMVANFAATHGATAAAKQFGIPASVAAYYHRKVLKRHLPKGRRPSLPATFQFSSRQPPNSTRPVMSLMSVAGGSSCSTASASAAAANNIGGMRGRGRPKKIGDELDAQFIDYLCDLLMEGQPLTGDTVLQLARQFICKNAPGLLDIEGGTISLTTGWAGKELQRAHETLSKRRLSSQNAVESIAADRFADCATLLGQPQTSFDEAMSGCPEQTPDDVSAAEASMAAAQQSLGVFGQPALMLNESG